ncbi:Hypothetical protein PMT_2857 [Prochlorococcus marinus str. MIT 9313]|uniref:Uncharacterized protein n=1 Tax=Prochlorococcus marinus (strain MIT 9313) TaxID=74547 RepID=B9ESM6_PROMM|nr:Hypothetical protein PMT_2857 [Prochlorococcus marinus str. MIT 9313]
MSAIAQMFLVIGHSHSFSASVWFSSPVLTSGGKSALARTRRDAGWHGLTWCF